MQSLRYHLLQCLRNIKESLGIFLQTCLMMLIALLLVGAFAGVALQVEEILKHWEAEAPVLVYLQESAKQAEQHALLQSLRKRPEISRIKAISPKDAMVRLRTSLGQKRHLLDGLDSPIFPPSFEIELHPHARHPAAIKRLSQEIPKLQHVQEVDVGREWIAPLWRMARWIRAIFWMGGGLLLLSASLMVAGTIRLTLFLHQDEIEIMRLVGATESFIRAPFYLEGLLEGIFAALLAFVILVISFLFLDARYGEAFSAFTARSLRFFSLFQSLAFLAGGIAAGLFGSWIALRTGPAHNDAALF